jgi:hypothetical protein
MSKAHARPMNVSAMYSEESTRWLQQNLAMPSHHEEVCCTVLRGVAISKQITTKYGFK